jgi:hypothetical protein
MANVASPSGGVALGGQPEDDDEDAFDFEEPDDVDDSLDDDPAESDDELDESCDPTDVVDFLLPESFT